MLIKNVSVLYGKELTFVPSINLKISEQVFKKIKPNLSPSRKEVVFDCEGLLLVPGFVNAHTHIGDSIGKDITLNKDVDGKIHPIFGVKPKILKKSNPAHLSNFMKNTCHSMITGNNKWKIFLVKISCHGLSHYPSTLQKAAWRSIREMAPLL